MDQQSIQHGFVVACDTAGTVRRPICGGLPERDVLESGICLTDLVETGSQSKVRAFLAAAGRDGSVYDWEIILEMNGEPTLYHFAGYLNSGELIVVAAESGPELMGTIEELAAINNEYAALFRNNIKMERATAREEARRLVYEDMSALNNELVTVSRHLEKTNRELEKCVEENHRWMGIVAHDLRNPLGVITAYTEFLQRSADPLSPEKVQEIFNVIYISAEYMSGLVNQVLDFSAIESGYLVLDLEPVDLIELIGQAVHFNTVIADQKGIDLTFAAEHIQARSDVDRIKIRQVINNLLGNALKFTQKGGAITVNAHKQDGMLTVTVCDNGPGIAPEKRDQLFEPFRTAGTKTNGGETSTGLGLAICKRIVEGHCGHMEVDSEMGKGSTFSFRLPIST